MQEFTMTLLVVHLKVCVYFLATAAMGWHMQCDDMMSLGATCPYSCICCLVDFACSKLSLRIDCFNETNDSQLSQQLNNMLFNLSNNKGKSVVNLQIDISFQNDLNKIPEEICNLKSLEILILRITYLQNINSSCFKKMSNLSTFEVSSSRNLTSLPDDLFEGLNNLKTIEFIDNKIIDLQPALFDHLVGVFYSLQTISFKGNNLQTIDVWPLFIDTEFELVINLENNDISHFTNKLNKTIPCRAPIHLGLGAKTVSFMNNNITRISDLVKGWNIPGGYLSCVVNDYFELNFAHNPLICDCVDYEIYMQMNTKKYMSHTTDTLYCISPLSMTGVQLASRFHNMDSFVCDINDNCPEGCKCEQHPNKATVIISCEGLSLKHIPLTLPALPKATFPPYNYILNFAKNQLTHLENYSCLNRTSLLFLSNNNLDYIDPDVWK